MSRPAQTSPQQRCHATVPASRIGDIDETPPNAAPVAVRPPDPDGLDAVRSCHQLRNDHGRNQLGRSDFAALQVRRIP
jgi:hypothetical protein